MLYQENSDLDDVWLNAHDLLTSFSKYREWVVGRTKGAESPYVQGPQYFEENLVVSERSPRGMIFHQPGILLPTLTMRMLFNYVTMVIVLIVDKYQS